MELLTDPFLWGLILTCVGAVVLMQGVSLDSKGWGFVGYAILAVVAVLVALTWEG